MTTISELIAILEAIKTDHGDIPVRKLEYEEWSYEEGCCCPHYEDVEEVWFITDKDEPQTSDNPYADGFIVIQ